MTADSGRWVLVLNAGSSSLKFALFEAERRLCAGQVEAIGTPHPRLLVVEPGHEPAIELPAATDHATALGEILNVLARGGIEIGNISACGHRIVHGGADHVAPVMLDTAQLGALQSMRELAPLHNGFGVAAIEALRGQAPGLPQVACFDTAFHATVPEVAQRFALPTALHEAG